MTGQEKDIHGSNDSTPVTAAHGSPQSRAITPAFPISRIRTKASSLPVEEKNKLLFEVFDMLLRNDREIAHSSHAPLASTSKNRRVKKNQPDHSTRT